MSMDKASTTLKDNRCGSAFLWSSKWSSPLEWPKPFLRGCTKLGSILEGHSDLALCHAMKEEMSRLFGLRDPDEALRGWTAWFQGAKASGIPALVRFARLKEKRLDGLVAHARHNISTGRLEGFNNKVKVAKRVGYGYRNEDYFFTLVRYLSIPSVRTSSPRKT